MKTTLARSLTLAALLCTLSAAPTMAATDRTVTIDQANLHRLSPSDQQLALRIADRLEVISHTDLAGMDRNERKALRSEARELKREADALAQAAGGTVIYISGIGLILIIILLIVLL
jgi:predicted deacylase